MRKWNIPQKNSIHEYELICSKNTFERLLCGCNDGQANAQVLSLEILQSTDLLQRSTGVNNFGLFTGG